MVNEQTLLGRGTKVLIGHEMLPPKEDASFMFPNLWNCHLFH